MIDEKWAKIPGSDDAYASTLGRIMRHNLVVRQYPDSEGYMRVSVGGTVGRQRVNRLVLMAFKEQPVGKTIPNHKNRRKDDNRITNLEWSTHRENSLLAAAQGAWSGHHPVRKIKGTEISTGKVTVFDSQSAAARDLGIHNSEINKMLHGKRMTCHGWIFEYMDDESPVVRFDKQIPGQMSLFEV